MDRARAHRLSRYLLSLPERALRSVAAVSAGLVREVGEITLPPGLRRTRLYNIIVESTLRFLIERVGQVDGTYPAGGQAIDHFLVKRALGDGIDLAGWAAFGASPIWVLAAFADLSGAGRQLMSEIVQSLKDQGLLETGGKFANVDQMLDGLERTSGQLAASLRYPPLDIGSLRRDWNELKAAAQSIPPRNLPPPAVLRERWDALKQEAALQGRSVFELSSLVALATIRKVPANMWKLSRSAATATIRTGQFFAQGLFDHYASILREIHETGYLAYWKREFQPYLHAAAVQFSMSHRSLTEQWLDRRGASKGEAKTRG